MSTKKVTILKRLGNLCMGIVRFFSSDRFYKFLIFIISTLMLTSIAYNNLTIAIKVIMVFGVIFTGCLIALFADYVIKETKKL